MDRQTVGRGPLGVLSIAAFLLGLTAASAAPPGELEDGRLYLSQTVETGALPNLLTAGKAFVAGRPYVLQLDRAITPDLRRALETAGVGLADYLPKNAYIVELGGVSRAELEALAHVTWLGEFREEWKLDPGLGHTGFMTPERQALAASGQLAVLITLFRGHTAEELEQHLAQIDGAVIHDREEVGGNLVLAATMPRAAAPGLAALQTVQYVEESPELTPRNATVKWVVQTNVSNSTTFYTNGIHGEGQIVGLLDGAPDKEHCSLNGGKIIHYNGPDGNDGHGTHTAATAVGDNGVNDNTRGMAYRASLVWNPVPR